MRKGFFKSSQLAIENKRQSKFPACSKCELHKFCDSPKMEPSGSGELKILFVAEIPGRQEDIKGTHFVGPIGKYLQKVCLRFGIDIHQCKKTNACACYKLKGKAPTDTEIAHCRPNVLNLINEFQPHLIIPLGGAALKSVIGNKFISKIGGIRKWRGFIIPDRQYKAWVCPTFHPSFVRKEEAPEYAETLFKEDLADAFKMLEYPVPEYTSEKDYVELISKKKEINSFLKSVLEQQNILTSFDYETSGLKPQPKKMWIASASISLGADHAVAFPFLNDADFLKLFKQYLERVDIKKIVANLKFERDWSAVKLNTKLKGIYFDTMIAAHFLDNRQQITSLDFQNYINFGLSPYNQKVKKYLESEGGRGTSVNSIDKLDLKNLLLYNGLDSITEFRNGLIMMDRIGINYSKFYKEATGYDYAPQYKYIQEAKCK